MAKYWEYMRISFLTILAFRARYYVGIVTYLIYIGVYYFIWKAVYQARPEGPGGTIDSFGLRDMITYTAIGWVARSFLFNNLDRDVEAKVIDGSLAMDLLKPVDFMGMQYARVLGEGLFRLVLFALPTLALAALLFPVGKPAGWGALAAFVFSTAMGWMVSTHINWMCGVLAIPLRNIEGLSWAKQSLILFLSGLLVPFDMFPGWLAAAMKALPFAGISYIPLSLYLGKLRGAELAWALGVQAAWAVAMYAAARGLWLYMMRRVTIQGG